MEVFWRLKLGRQKVLSETFCGALTSVFDVVWWTLLTLNVDDKRYIEIPQLPKPHRRRFSRRALREDGVFILDDGADMYVWKGKRSSRLLRARNKRTNTLFGADLCPFLLLFGRLERISRQLRGVSPPYVSPLSRAD